MEFAVGPGDIKRIPLTAPIPTFRKVFLGEKDPAVEWLEKERPDLVRDKMPVDWRWRVLRGGMTLLLFVPAYIPPLLYRISLKATCIVYAPFVWVAGVTAGISEPREARLERIARGKFEAYRRRFSGFVMSIALAKWAVNHGLIGSTSALDKIFFGNSIVMHDVLGPKAWQWWQCAFIFDAAVTLCLGVFADAALSRLRLQGDNQGAQLIADSVYTLTFIRAAVAVTIMACSFAVVTTYLLGSRFRL